jgi:hypothetical protein
MRTGETGERLAFLGDADLAFADPLDLLGS